MKWNLSNGLCAALFAAVVTGAQLFLIFCFVISPAFATSVSTNLAITVTQSSPCAISGTVVNLSPSSNIQAAINAALSGTTLVFSPGTYAVPNEITVANGLSLVGQAGAILHSTTATAGGRMLVVDGVSNVNICGLQFNGQEGAGTHTFGAAVFVAGSDNIHLTRNISQHNASFFQMFNSAHIYVQGNTSNFDFEPISWTNNNNTLHDGLYITDNTVSYWYRNGIEGGCFCGSESLNPQANMHIDRNVLVNDGRDTAPGGGLMLSIVPGNGTSNNTIWGNHCSDSTLTDWCIELAVNNTTVEQNVSNGVQTGIQISHAAGTAVLNNTFTGFNTVISSGGAPFGQDGGYDGTEWIGSNTWNGVHVTGWPGGPAAYGAQPVLYSPSPAFP